MKVHELIEVLTEFNNPDAEVVVLFSDDNPIRNDGELIESVFEIQGHKNTDVNGVYIDCTVG